MLSYNDLKKGTLFLWNGEPYEVLDYNFMRMQQRKPVAQTKIRNIKTGSVSTHTFKPSDMFSELNIQRKPVIFLYSHRGQYTFHPEGKVSERFILSEEKIGDNAHYLKANSAVEARYIENELLDIILPIKVDLKVIEAPPAVRGDTAQGGLKQVTLETGLKMNVPLFINEGDTVRINTESGAYIERANK